MANPYHSSRLAAPAVVTAASQLQVEESKLRAESGAWRGNGSPVAAETISGLSSAWRPGRDSMLEQQQRGRKTSGTSELWHSVEASAASTGGEEKTTLAAETQSTE